MPRFVGRGSRGSRGASSANAPSSSSSSALTGRASVEECLSLQLAAADDSHLVQVCVVDHSSYAPPHLHLQLLFADRSRSPWVGVNNATLLDLQAVLDALLEQTGHVRVHLHEPAPTSNPASAAVVEALPRHVLEPCDVELLQSDGTATWPICLCEYTAGDEVVCMPCRGLHKAHWPCMSRWLEGASTCPTCRYALPTKVENETAPSSDLMQRAELEMERVRNGEPAPCRPVEDGSAEGEVEGFSEEEDLDDPLHPRVDVPPGTPDPIAQFADGVVDSGRAEPVVCDAENSEDRGAGGGAGETVGAGEAMQPEVASQTVVVGGGAQVMEAVEAAGDVGGGEGGEGVEGAESTWEVGETEGGAMLQAGRVSPARVGARAGQPPGRDVSVPVRSSSSSSASAGSTVDAASTSAGGVNGRMGVLWTRPSGGNGGGGGAVRKPFAWGLRLIRRFTPQRS